MAIIWNKIIPRWGGDTMEPPEAKKDVGYIAGDNPPAKWENWLRKGTYEALGETRDVIENIDSQLARKAYYEAFGMNAQSIPNATWQQMVFNERLVRGGSDINMTSLNGGQINFKKVGVYEIKIVYLTFDANPSGFRVIRLMPSAAVLSSSMAVDGIVTTFNATLNFTVTVPDTTIAFEVYQSSGAALNLSTSFHINKL